MESLSLLSFSRKGGVGENWVNLVPLMGIKKNCSRSEKNKKSMTIDIVHLCKLLRSNR
jgi:hypothetical protein